MSEMGQKATSQDVRATSSLPPKTDILLMGWHVRKVPPADVT
jgi:hypothetical protein